MNTVAGVYINELFEALGPDEDYMIFHTLAANMGMTHADGYYYFQQGANANYDQNHTTSGIIVTLLQPEGYYDTGENYNITQSMWWAYTDSGIWAGIELHAEGAYEAYDDDDLMDEGTIEFIVDIRLVNPDYNPLPPDDIPPTGGFPGFTLMIVIPVIITFGIGTVSYTHLRAHET